MMPRPDDNLIQGLYLTSTPQIIRVKFPSILPFLLIVRLLVTPFPRQSTFMAAI